MSKRKFVNGILWDESVGIGYYGASVHDSYGDDYFEKYAVYENTDLGRRINKERVKLVKKHIDASTLVDFGCGSGSFIKERGGGTWGYDVCQKSVKWLVDNGLWWDPWFKRMPSASFWDSMEHVENLDHLLSRVEKYAFLSIPIFTSLEHVLSSKHFRPNEHFHYFTERGLTIFMKARGFSILESNRMETDLGREDIGTFVFAR